jgi:hypothetical protein
MTVLVQIAVRAAPRTEQLQDLAQTGPGRLETRSASQPGSCCRHGRVAARHRLGAGGRSEVAGWGWWWSLISGDDDRSLVGVRRASLIQKRPLSVPHMRCASEEDHGPSAGPASAGRAT